MRITDEPTADRIQDAAAHDEVFLMVGEEGTERPLLKLSVSNDGHGVIEYEHGDLAAGIRQLNKMLSGALRGEHGDLIRLVPEESRA